MVWQYVIGGALVGAAVLLDSDEDHHDVVQQTVNNLEPELPEHASLYADHLGDGYPNPRGAFTGIDNAPEDHIPDVVVTSGIKNNLIIEVETGDSIEESSSAAKSQIDDFSIPGYRRVAPSVSRRRLRRRPSTSLKSTSTKRSTASSTSRRRRVSPTCCEVRTGAELSRICFIRE